VFNIKLNFYKIHKDFLKFGGNDRLDLINRLSTNDVKSLAPSEYKKTILTNDKGRFVDMLNLYNFDDFVFASCSSDNAANVIQYLDKYTIMDDFRVENMNGTHASVLCFGDNVDDFSKRMFGLDIQTFPTNQFHIDSLNGKDSIIAHNDDAFGGFIFIYAKEDESFQFSRIFSEELKTKYKIHEIIDNEFESMRIEYGIPEFGKEMTEQTNPLECNLEKYINFSKGCYIGQEVIARLDAYDKISKHIIGIISESPIPDTNNNRIKIIFEGKESGFVTSSAKSKKFGNIGLGFVRTILLDTEKEYFLKNDTFESKCKIINLPFK
jgi:folate-binding protein YgfZ